MKQYEALAGDTIGNACFTIAAKAILDNEPYGMKFNGIDVVAQPGDLAQDLEAKWWEESSRCAEAYRNSSEGQTADRKLAEEVRALQAQADSLVQQLMTLDYSNLDELVQYFANLQPASDHIGVIVNNRAVVFAFATHGFLPNANTGEDFDEENRENYARYLLGQALAGLTEGSTIPGVYHAFVQRWRDKFASTGSSC